MLSHATEGTKVAPVGVQQLLQAQKPGRGELSQKEALPTEIWHIPSSLGSSLGCLASCRPSC